MPCCLCPPAGGSYTKKTKTTPSRLEKEEEKKSKKNLAGKSNQHTVVEMFEAFAVYLYGLL